jgi:hypothetical protein
MADVLANDNRSALTRLGRSMRPKVPVSDAKSQTWRDLLGDFASLAGCDHGFFWLCKIYTPEK